MTSFPTLSEVRSARRKSKSSKVGAGVGYLLRPRIHTLNMPKPLAVKWYGWKPDTPDRRDRYRIARPRVEPLPDLVDLREKFPPPYDQGDLGSCTANAIAGLLEFDQLKQPGGGANFTPSRLFIYYGERVIEGTIKEDSGAQIRSGIKVVGDQGAPPETIWPYDIGKFTKKPSAKSYREAKKHQAITYERLCQRIDDMRGCLADGFPFAFGFSVYDGFESDEVAKTGQVLYPKPDEQMLGGHAVACCGYDHPKSIFIVRNSWGEDWGQKGYFTIPYEYVLDRDLADDFWTIRLIEEVADAGN